MPLSVPIFKLIYAHINFQISLIFATAIEHKLTKKLFHCSAHADGDGNGNHKAIIAAITINNKRFGSENSQVLSRWRKNNESMSLGEREKQKLFRVNYGCNVTLSSFYPTFRQPSMR